MDSICRPLWDRRAAARSASTPSRYDLLRFLKATPSDATEDLYVSSPLHFLGGLEGAPLDALRERFVLIASGRGNAEDIEESFRVARLLEAKGVPHRMDDWGQEWHHDWPTWRNMLYRYVDELTPPSASEDHDEDATCAS